MFGLALIRELARHGDNVSPGTVYPVLHTLQRRGYLTRQDRVMQGKVRKCYRTLPRGRAALAEARAKITELVAEVLRMEGPRCLVRRIMRPDRTGDAPRMSLA